MGRHSQGWKLRQRAPGHAFAVRFSHGGTEYERSTGTADRVQAAREAARIYAEVVSSEPVKQRPRRYRDSTPLEDLVGAWLASAPLDPKTAVTFELYAGSHWIPWFGEVRNISTAMAEQYIEQRLRSVLASTVRKEVSALRSFVRWLQRGGSLSTSVVVPGVPSSSRGTPYGKRRRSAAIELSPREVQRIIAQLPAWSTSRRVDQFPIRARFVVGYETGLRPATLDLLSVPEHWAPGASVLRVTADVDKEGWEREVPLSPKAIRALSSVAPKAGVVFGTHDYRPHLRAAAEAVLGPARAKRFAGTHLRSARITHLLEQTGNIPGVQHLVGHRRAETTAIYVRPSFRAAADAIAGKR